MTEHWTMFAHYNQWANRQVYQSAAALSQAELNDDRGAFFGSLLRTLNHILVADRIWMRRFTGEGEAPASLDAILFADLEPLDAARRAEDERILSWIGGLTADRLAANFSYVSVVNPEPVTQRLGGAVAHFFNHQTHHRGQCHMILTSLGKPSLALDLVYFQRQYEGGRFL